MNKLISVILLFVVSCSHVTNDEKLNPSLFMGLISLEKTNWTETEKTNVRIKYENLLKNLSSEINSEQRTVEVALRNLDLISTQLEKEHYELSPYEDVLFLSDFFTKKKADQITLALLYYSIGNSLKLPISVETDKEGSNYFISYNIDSKISLVWIPEKKMIRGGNESIWKGEYPSTDPTGLIHREHAWKSFLDKDFSFAHMALLFNAVNKLPHLEEFDAEARFFGSLDHKEETLDCGTFKVHKLGAQFAYTMNKLAVCYLAKKEWANAISILEKENSDYLSTQLLLRAYYYNEEYQKALSASQRLIGILNSLKDKDIAGRKNRLLRELKFQNAILKKIEHRG